MPKIYGDFITGRGAIGLLILRLVTGGALVQHGAQKVFDPAGPMQWMGPGASMPGFLQFLAALSEFGGGLALIFGFLTPLAMLGIMCTMGVAIMTAHHGQPWVSAAKTAHPFESAASYFGVALTLLVTGPGALSLDSLIFNKANKRV